MSSKQDVYENRLDQKPQYNRGLNRKYLAVGLPTLPWAVYRLLTIQTKISNQLLLDSTLYCVY